MSGRRLILLRHGRTGHNADGLMQGQLDVPLDQTGLSQAKAAAEVLASGSPSLLVSSDLARARATAEPVAAAAGLTVQLDERLRELDLGTWQGLSGEQARAAHPVEYAAWRAGQDVRRGGGETYAEAGARARGCVLDNLPSVPDGGTLIAVTHGGTARATLGLLLELPAATWGRLAPLGNCCWSVVVEADWGWRLERHGAGVDPQVGPTGHGSFGAREKP